ncbi:MAG: hypothetical protein KIS91_00515 [Anaerolineae bacterium]|nr:hypothetical protein [Anaerolineae bacterium]
MGREQVAELGQLSGVQRAAIEPKGGLRTGEEGRRGGEALLQGSHNLVPVALAEGHGQAVSGSFDDNSHSFSDHKI